MVVRTRLESQKQVTEGVLMRYGGVTGSIVSRPKCVVSEALQSMMVPSNAADRRLRSLGIYADVLLRKSIPGFGSGVVKLKQANMSSVVISRSPASKALRGHSGSGLWLSTQNAVLGLL